MRVLDHFKYFRRHISRSGIPGALEYFSKAYYRNVVAKQGINVYTRDWDVLIILDACRVDTLQSLRTEYSFLNDIREIWSVGSSSAEWMRNTFTDDYHEEMSNTVYVSGNPFTKNNITVGDFDAVYEMWKYSWDKEIGTILPRPLTDKSIQVMRSGSPNRLIVHYMQPHFPCVPNPVRSGYLPDEAIYGTDDIWDDIRRGNVSKATAYERYSSNLKYILDEINILLTNIDAGKVVITADHGNAFGENWIWGHPGKVQHPKIRKVPWVTTNATDKESHIPEHVNRSELDIGVENQLRDLGYK